MRFVMCVILASLFANDAIADEQTTIIHAGTLLAVPGNAPATKQSIIIEGRQIVRVEDGFVDPADLSGDVTVIDLSDKFVLPGLMDMHVHLLGELGPNSRTDALHVTTSMQALKGAMHAKRTLEAGFTTVRDLGGKPEAIYALRDAIDDGFVPGPRIFAAGSSLAATGGHGDVDGVKAELLTLWTPETICDGPYDCRRATRYAIKYGADWIKITATGGVLSDTATGTDQQMTDDELKEIIDTAHGLGVRVAAHAHGTDGINAALRAGVDTIDHGSFLDRESISLFRQTGAYLVPTLSPGYKIPAQMEGNPFFTEAIKAKALAAAAASKANFGSAYDAGVKIAFGTDTGVTKHGENADEFGMMVENGMTEMDAIRSATVVAAELLEMSDTLGTIEPGKMADIIAVDLSPLDDITVLESVTAVIKNGKRFK
ncbi:MAG: amidohydrolase family protein [Proteobacteria bacterium]|nr:amidohydrolase family protein [Pseudomonadota bacterium]TDJ36020.1 MAG: amidohydrolase family protein [Gammaproteobacteria bacterium]